MLGAPLGTTIRVSFKYSVINLKFDLEKCRCECNESNYKYSGSVAITGETGIEASWGYRFGDRYRSFGFTAFAGLVLDAGGQFGGSGGFTQDNCSDPPSLALAASSFAQLGVTLGGRVDINWYLRGVASGSASAGIQGSGMGHASLRLSCNYEWCGLDYKLGVRGEWSAWIDVSAKTWIGTYTFGRRIGDTTPTLGIDGTHKFANPFRFD